MSNNYQKFVAKSKPKRSQSVDDLKPIGEKNEQGEKAASPAKLTSEKNSNADGDSKKECKDSQEIKKSQKKRVGKLEIEVS